MGIAVELLALGESVVEGTVSRWLVKPGDRVERDQSLVEVTTDKVDAELPSPAAGWIAELCVAEGETVAVGTTLAWIRDSAPVDTPDAGPPAAPEPRATPLARRLAEQAGVELAELTPAGPAGRITRADVEAAAQPAEGCAGASSGSVRSQPPPSQPPPGASRPAYLDYALQPGDRLVAMSPLRRLVAEHMVLSKRISPHVGTLAEVDLGGVVELRRRHQQGFREAHGFGLSYLPFIVQATVRALREHPRLNASVLDDAIVEKRDIHVGIAVETDKGLVVPVVRHADRLSLTGLAQAIEDLGSRARARQLSPDELRGGSFTVSNPGRQGNLYGFAIIHQPQVGILRLGELVKRPVVRSIDGADAIVIRPIVHLALSYDHRAVDGAPANAFLHRVRELLEAAEFDL